MSPDDAAPDAAAAPAPAPPPADDPPAKAAEASPAAEEPKRRGRGRIVAVVVLGLLVAALVAGAVWALSPTKPKDYEEEVPLATSEPNTLAYGALASLGIGGPVTSVEEGRIHALYDLRTSPADADWLKGLGSSAPAMDPDDLQRAAIGALAAALPDALSIEVEQLDNLTHRTTWTVAMGDVVAFFDGELTVEQFEARITKS